MTIAPAQVTALRALSRREGTTLYMTLLAGFGALLHQYTGQTDLAVGSVIANRDRAEVEPLVGFFANTLVLRLDLTGPPTFRELLARVRNTCLGAYAHQLPPETLLQTLAPPRAETTALYDVWFQLETAPHERPALGAPDRNPRHHPRRDRIRRRALRRGNGRSTGNTSRDAARSGRRSP
ncbi:MAG: hypothetical protein AUI36_41090 [Cyanobacteria bacterium 13_1_40CM_2_61_4]|nr:MAG: hypothetical protein AUI36_41090 [Cyanobacteria bacterium 13_1_40CM_2_61_4]